MFSYSLKNAMESLTVMLSLSSFYFDTEFVFIFVTLHCTLDDSFLSKEDSHHYLSKQGERTSVILAHLFSHVMLKKVNVLICFVPTIFL